MSSNLWTLFGLWLYCFGGGDMTSGPLHIYLIVRTLFLFWSCLLSGKPNQPTEPNIHIALNPYPLRSCNYGYYKKCRRGKDYHRRSRLLRPNVDRKKKKVKLVERNSTDWSKPTTPEDLEHSRREQCALIQHKFLTHSCIWFDMQLGVNLTEFVKGLDPTKSTRDLHEAAALFKESRLPLPVIGVDSRPNSNLWHLANVAMKASLGRSVFPGPPLVLEDKFSDIEDKTLHYNFNAALHRDETPIVIDTGASFSLTPFKEDFCGGIEETNMEDLQGLSSRTKVHGTGFIEWTIVDLYGVVRTIKTRAYYVPEASIRLFSPQCYLQEQGKGEVIIRQNKTVMRMPDDVELEFPFNPGSNLPLMLLTNVRVKTAGLYGGDMMNLCSEEKMSSFLSVADERNQNLTEAQKELLLWHQRWGHANFQWNQALLRSQQDGTPPIVHPKKPTAGSCDTSGLLCAACQMSKATRRATQEARRTSLFDSTVIRKGDLSPGQAVSMDQFMSMTPGRLPNTKGKEPDTHKFNGGTIMVDHASQFIFVFNQVSLRIGETLQGKTAFEQFADSAGVKIKHYRADNAPFGAKEFRDNLELSGQTIDYSGVGAHHQNGVAERAIMTTTRLARCMI